MSYKNNKNFASDRRVLKQPVLTPAATWDMEQDSEPEWNTQYKQLTLNDPHTDSTVSTESEDSKNAPLLSPKRTPGRITTPKLEITIGDKTGTVKYLKKQLARETISLKVPEPQGTLKPQ